MQTLLFRRQTLLLQPLSRMMVPWSSFPKNRHNLLLWLWVSWGNYVHQACCHISQASHFWVGSFESGSILAWALDPNFGGKTSGVCYLGSGGATFWANWVGQISWIPASHSWCLNEVGSTYHVCRSNPTIFSCCSGHGSFSTHILYPDSCVFTGASPYDSWNPLISWWESWLPVLLRYCKKRIMPWQCGGRDMAPW